MPKVHNTNIDDNFNDEQNKKHKTRHGKTDFDIDEEDDDFQKVNIAPPMFHIEGVGLFRLHSISCVEKEFDFGFTQAGESRPRWGLTINKGMTPSTYFPKTDLTLYWNDEASRDKVYDNIIDALEQCGTEFYNV